MITTNQLVGFFYVFNTLYRLYAIKLTRMDWCYSPLVKAKADASAFAALSLI